MAPALVVAGEGLVALGPVLLLNGFDIIPPTSFPKSAFLFTL